MHTPHTHNSTQRFYLSWPCFTTGPTRYATSGLRAHVTYNTLGLLSVRGRKKSGTEREGKREKKGRKSRGERKTTPNRRTRVNECTDLRHTLGNDPTKTEPVDSRRLRRAWSAAQWRGRKRRWMHSRTDRFQRPETNDVPNAQWRITRNSLLPLPR